MLQIRQICKQYETGGLVQKALDGVSLTLRENEFVAVLGPSGSGKTTLLNIIGGLDRYDSGDLIINGVSTKKYKERDWDSYRNHTVGFVFQSYNLIPHQSVLANVELSLTISGVSGEERKKRAAQALQKVGLGDQLHKKPNQMSGGQMQRVAIARALVNDPDILLADEPTGALDSETSVQVMELLKEVSRDRLVVMVTHNPELAEAYATRIITLRDGRIRSDSDPFEEHGDGGKPPVHRNMGKTSMSFLTALSLSFQNLKTKKARTILTSFAGSIGIIGIALILSVSNGVNGYIQTIEADMLAQYPLQIRSSEMNLTANMSDSGSGEDSGGSGSGSSDGSESGPDDSQADGTAGSSGTDGAEDGTAGSSGTVGVSEMLTSVLSGVSPNDLGSLKAWLESGESGIEKYTRAVEYSYDITPQIYRQDGEEIRQVSPENSLAEAASGASTDSTGYLSSFLNMSMFREMPENTDLYQDQYDVVAGRWPEKYDECVVILTSGGNISDLLQYTLGLRDESELTEMMRQYASGEQVNVPESSADYRYGDLLGITFKIVNAADYYQYDETTGIWTDRSSDAEYLRGLVESGEDMTVVGIVQPSEDVTSSMLDSGIGYPASLTEHLMEQAAESPVVAAQTADPKTNILTGVPFGEESGAAGGISLDSLFSIDENALRQALGSGFGGAVSSAGTAGLFGSGTSSGSSGPDLSGLNSIGLPDSLASDLPDSLTDSGVLSGFGSLLNLDDILDPGTFRLSLPDISDLLQEVQLPDVSELFDFSGLADAEKILPDIDISGLLGQIRLPDLSLSSGQVQELISSVAEGYRKYAAENPPSDGESAGQHFAGYLQTPEAQELLSAGISGILGGAVDTDALKSQITGELESYAETVRDAYAQELNRILEEQAPQLMERFLGQLMQQALEQAADQAGAQLAQQIGSRMQQISSQIQERVAEAVQQMSAQIAGRILEQAAEAAGTALSVDTDALADAVTMNLEEEDLAGLFRSLMSAEDSSYEGNLEKFGYADPDSPDGIDIYPLDFESKAAVLDILDSYNQRMRAEDQDDKVISYTDMTGMLMSSVTEIVDTVSYVLIAFVATSLVVSSIMIGVITYISVLERRKEIGILRAIGASRRNISQVFNAETFIIGLCAGVIGIVLTLLILIPGNALLHTLIGSEDVHASLPAVSGIVLVLLSILLTLVGGLISSKKAAKSDPVKALRAE